MKKSHWFLTGCLLFFLFILFLSPISGDDWGNYLVGSLGLRHMIGQAIGMYFSWEGRFLNRILINLLTYHKFLWNIVNSLVLVSIIFLSSCIYPFKNKKMIMILLFLSILFMNVFTFSQVVVWIAGNLTYLFVFPLLLLYIKLLYQKVIFSPKQVVFLFFLNFIIPMFVEHMGLLLIFFNIYFLVVEYIRHHKISKVLFLFLLCSIGSFLLMFWSPGNRIRSSMENLDFNHLNLFGKIGYNLPNFVSYTYIINYFLLFLIFIGSILLIRHCISHKIVRLFCYLYECFSLVLGFHYLLSSFQILSISLFSSSHILVIIYYLSFTIFNFYLLLKNSKNSFEDLSVIFYSAGILANAVMLMSPTWGNRTSFATYFFLVLSFLIVLDRHMKENKYIIRFCSIFVLGGISFYSIFYINIHQLYMDNLKKIRQSIRNNDTVIELVAYPGFAPCNINPLNDYHLDKFKKYYGIDSNVEVKLISGHWKFIFYRK